jgi:hypothetical protein
MKRPSFSEAEQALIARIEKTGASFEKNRHGWGFVNASDKALKLIKKLSGIQFLDLFETCEAGEVSDEGLVHINDLAGLRYVALGPGISDAGLAHVARLTELNELRLDSAADVTDIGLEALKDLGKLQSLSLQYTGVMDEGLVHLSGLKRLKELNLEGTAVTQRGVASLQKTLPKCKMLWNPETVRPIKTQKPKTPGSAASGYQLKLRATLRGHANKPSDAAFSPDGSLLMSVDFGKVLLWNLASGAKHASIGVKRGALWGAAFTPDSKHVAAGSNLGCVFLWDTSGKEKSRLEASTPVFTALDIDPGGKYLAAGGQDGNLYLWELPAGELRSKNPATAGDFFCAVAFSPDGKTVATCARESRVCLWTVPAGKKKLELQAPPHKSQYEKVQDAAFSPDGATLASAHPDNGIRLWSISHGKEIASLTCPRPVCRLAYHPSGNLLATASDGDTLVRLWDPTTKQPIAEFETNADFNRVNLVAFSPDGQSLVTNGKGGSLLLLDVSGAS